MNMKHFKLSIYVFFLFYGLIISGCGPGQALGPTITPSPTNTLVPTSTLTTTPTLTPTFTPTLTPSPTFTPTPTIEPPSPLLKYFDNSSLTYYENFDEFVFEKWDTQSCQTAINGELEFACSYGFLNRKNSIQEGEGVLIDFKIDKLIGNPWWGMKMVSGNWETDSWRNFGIAHSGNNEHYVDIVKGTTFPYGFPPLSIRPDVWYRLALAIGEDGKVALLVWERDNANAERLNMRRTFGDEWSGLGWFFRIQNSKSVVIYFDNYYQFTFSEIK